MITPAACRPISATTPGPPFAVDGAPPAADPLRAGAGLGGELGDRLSAFVDHGLDWASDYLSQGVALSLVWRF